MSMSDDACPDQALDGAVTRIQDNVVVSVSTRETPDCNRWAWMPSVSEVCNVVGCVGPAQLSLHHNAS
jgi:hypothetical protein